jgi:hypothetical protein
MKKQTSCLDLITEEGYIADNSAATNKRGFIKASARAV